MLKDLVAARKAPLEFWLECGFLVNIYLNKIEKSPALKKSKSLLGKEFNRILLFFWLN